MAMGVGGMVSYRVCVRHNPTDAVTQSIKAPRGQPSNHREYWTHPCTATQRLESTPIYPAQTPPRIPHAQKAPPCTRPRTPNPNQNRISGLSWWCKGTAACAPPRALCVACSVHSTNGARRTHRRRSGRGATARDQPVEAGNGSMRRVREVAQCLRRVTSGCSTAVETGHGRAGRRSGARHCGRRTGVPQLMPVYLKRPPNPAPPPPTRPARRCWGLE